MAIYRKSGDQSGLKARAKEDFLKSRKTEKYHEENVSKVPGFDDVSEKTYKPVSQATAAVGKTAKVAEKNPSVKSLQEKYEQHGSATPISGDILATREHTSDGRYSQRAREFHQAIGAKVTTKGWTVGKD